MQSKDITIETTEVPGTKNALIISFKGELTSLCIDKISDLFDKIDYDSKIICNCRNVGVSLISSAALGEFMGGRKRLIEKGGDLVFSALHIRNENKTQSYGCK